MRLFGGSGNMVSCGNSTRTRAIGLLNFQALFAAAGRPSHLDTDTVLTGLSNTVCVREACVLLHHFGIVSKTAGSNNHGLCMDVECIAVFVFSNDTGNLAVLTEDQFFCRCVQENLHAVFIFAFLLESVDPAGTTALINVPCVETAGIVRREFFELNAVLLHPFDCIGRFVDEGTNQAGIAAPVTIVHDLLEGFVFGQRNVVVALHLGTDSENTFGEITCSADHAFLFKADDFSALFGCGKCCSGTGGTLADNDDVCCDVFFSCVRKRRECSKHCNSNQLFHVCFLREFKCC